MAVDASTIIEIFPEFAAVSETIIDFNIETAQDFVDEGVFGSRYDRALMYYTAHLLELHKRRGKSGGVTQERVGEVSRSYGSPSSNESLDSTSYGQIYKQMASTLGLTPKVV